MSKFISPELIQSLAQYSSETEWIEFKEGDCNASKIGKDISALANSAAYLDRDYAYRVWGIEDETHNLVGTSFDYRVAKAKGSQGLLIWLKQFVSSNANYEFEDLSVAGKKYVVLRVSRAVGQPVAFDKAFYIREGSSTTRLEASSAKEAELWHRLQEINQEERIALSNIGKKDIVEFLNLDYYYEPMNLPRPTNLDASLLPLREQRILVEQDDGNYSISTFGALVLARTLTAFPRMNKRLLRVIRFAGKGNFDILDDRNFDTGYAASLNTATDYILSVIPAEEVYEGVYRRIKRAYPEKAIRELLANMVIHQDLSDPTAGPLVCIYDNRIEFNNPGVTLIPIERVLNAPPKSRNQNLARVLRQMDLCEEGGTGWDIAVAACEDAHILPPKMTSDEQLGTRVTLYQGNSFSKMRKGERKEALYWHACLQYAQGESINNQTLRERFGLNDDRGNSLAMSRLIKECMDDGLIKEEDKDVGTKYRRYIPAWA